MILLRPYILGYKNRFARGTLRQHVLSSDALVALSLLFVMYGLYWGTFTVIHVLYLRDAIDGTIIYRSAGIALFGFSFLLVFSSFLSALGAFFASQDLPLILVAPLSKRKFFISKFVETFISAAWLFVFLLLPVVFGLAQGLALPWYYMLDAVFLLLMFAAIPTAIGIFGAILFVNYFPIARLGDIVVIFILAMVTLFFLIGEGGLLTEVTRALDASAENSQMVFALSPYLPSTWVASLLVRTLPGTEHSSVLYLPFLAIVLLTILATYGVFESLYMRGYATTFESSTRKRVTALALHLPFESFGQPRPMLALMRKEAKLFFRDTAQALQLALILVLTLVYLYNFRSLQGLSNLSPDALKWWAALLSSANVFMGASVSSAIATRFVFPAVSLEGRAYHLLRVTPLSISDLIRAKFLSWFIPISVLTLVLLVSGAFAIQATPSAIAVTAVIAIAISAGIVGLGIGAGAMYARFDWDSPHQIFSHFGSLVYMLLSIGVIMLSLIPVSYLFILLSVPELFDGAPSGAYFTSVFFSLFLVVFINVAAASSALRSAEISLTDLERA